MEVPSLRSCACHGATLGCATRINSHSARYAMGPIWLRIKSLLRNPLLLRILSLAKIA
jgi:hypothetical protein